MLYMQPYRTSLPSFCPCCSAAIPAQEVTTDQLFSQQEFTLDPLFSPQDLIAEPLSSCALTMDQQSVTPIQSQSPAMTPPLLPTQQQQSAMAAQYRLTPEQEAILREHVTSASVMQALDVARESEEGATEPKIVKIITDAYNKVWNKIVTRPDLYLMTEMEFTLFNYFQDFWPDKETARRAVARFWDNPWAWETAGIRGRS